MASSQPDDELFAGGRPAQRPRTGADSPNLSSASSRPDFLLRSLPTACSRSRFPAGPDDGGKLCTVPFLNVDHWPVDQLVAKLNDPLQPPLVQVATLASLREAVLSGGPQIQARVFHSSAWDWLLRAASAQNPGTVDAACRVLSALVAGQAPIATAFLRSSTFQAVITAIVESAAPVAFRSSGGGGGDTEVFPRPVNPSAPGSDPQIVLTATCAASCMWLLCSSVMCSPDALSVIAGNQRLLSAIVGHLNGGIPEACAASAWLLYSLCSRMHSAASTLVNDHGAVTGLYTVLNGCADESRVALSLWALQSLCASSTATKLTLHASGVLTRLLPLLSHANPSVAAAAIWCCSTLATGVVAIQQDVLDSGILAIILQLTRPGVSVPQVRDQAIAALYKLAAAFPPAQSFLGENGALDILCDLLPTQTGSVRTVGRVLSTLLCLSLKHSDNQKRVVAIPGAVSRLVKLLTCSSPRIQGLTAGLIRTLLSKQPTIQVLFAAYGAMVPLLELCAGTDRFASEQAVAALYNCVAQHSGNRQLLASLGTAASSPLTKLLLDVHVTALTFLCAVMLALSIIDVVELPGVLRRVGGLLDATLPRVQQELLTGCCVGLLTWQAEALLVALSKGTPSDSEVAVRVIHACLSRRVGCVPGLLALRPGPHFATWLQRYSQGCSPLAVYHALTTALMCCLAVVAEPGDRAVFAASLRSRGVHKALLWHCDNADPDGVVAFHAAKLLYILYPALHYAKVNLAGPNLALLRALAVRHGTHLASGRLARCIPSCCAETLEARSSWHILPCGHELHASCARGWLQQLNTCPRCASSVSASILALLGLPTQ